MRTVQRKKLAGCDLKAGTAGTAGGECVCVTPHSCLGSEMMKDRHRGLIDSGNNGFNFQTEMLCYSRDVSAGVWILRGAAKYSITGGDSHGAFKGFITIERVKLRSSNSERVFRDSRTRTGCYASHEPRSG